LRNCIHEYINIIDDERESQFNFLLTEKSKLFLKELSLEIYEEFQNIMSYNIEKNNLENLELNISDGDKLNTNNNNKNINNNYDSINESKFVVENKSKSKYFENDDEVFDLSILKKGNNHKKPKKNKPVFVHTKDLNKNNFENDFVKNSSDDSYNSFFDSNDKNANYKSKRKYEKEKDYLGIDINDNKKIKGRSKESDSDYDLYEQENLRIRKINTRSHKSKRHSAVEKIDDNIKNSDEMEKSDSDVIVMDESSVKSESEDSYDEDDKNDEDYVYDANIDEVDKDIEEEEGDVGENEDEQSENENNINNKSEEFCSDTEQKDELNNFIETSSSEKTSTNFRKKVLKKIKTDDSSSSELTKKVYR
jgi:hypothetical protein